MSRDYLDFIQDILDSLRDAQAFIDGFTFERFIQDKRTVNAVIRSLEVIGEAAGKIPPEIQSQYPLIPWKRMTGMRNKLMHEYFGVDYSIIWTVVKEELPPLLPQFESMRQRLPE
jgi:uncharacterized protein with HEPN domain